MTDRRNIFVPTRKVRGTVCGDRRKIAIGFPKALFDQINFLATTNGRSFNEQAIVLCESAVQREIYLTRDDRGQYQVRVG